MSQKVAIVVLSAVARVRVSLEAPRFELTAGSPEHDHRERPVDAVTVPVQLYSLELVVMASEWIHNVSCARVSIPPCAVASLINAEVVRNVLAAPPAAHYVFEAVIFEQESLVVLRGNPSVFVNWQTIVH